MDKIIIFYIDNEQYAVKLEDVISIEKQVFKSVRKEDWPAYVRAVENLRGALTPVIDLHQIFHQTALPEAESSRLILMNGGEFPIAFHSTGVKEIIDASIKKIENQDLLLNKNNSYFSGAIQMNEGIILLIDPKKLVNLFKDDLDALLSLEKLSV